jgi:hypothetical protein
MEKTGGNTPYIEPRVVNLWESKRNTFEGKLKERRHGSPCGSSLREDSAAGKMSSLQPN